MIIKTLQTSVNVLVMFSVWCAAVMFAIFVVVLVMYLAAIGGMTVHYLMHS
jgi:hypothetical protein